MPVKKQPTEIAADSSTVLLKRRQIRIAVNDGKTIRLEISSVPIMRIPKTTVTDVSRAMIML